MNWIDTPLFVYAYLDGHPAQRPAEAVLRAGSCASSVLVALEVFHVSAQHYGVGTSAAAAAVRDLLRADVQWARLEREQIAEVVQLQARYGIASADGALLLLARGDGGVLVTTDRRLVRAGEAEGVAVRNPVSPALARTVATWEEGDVPPRGLPRILRSVERWLRAHDPALADAFREATANGTVVPSTSA